MLCLLVGLGCFVLLRGGGDQERVQSDVSGGLPLGSVSISFAEIAAGKLGLREAGVEAVLASQSPAIGNAGGPLVVIWADLSHPKMPHVHNLMAQMEHRFAGRLHWGFRHFPQDQACNTQISTTRNPRACLLARAAYCTGEQFWNFWEILSKNPGHDDERSIRRIVC